MRPNLLNCGYNRILPSVGPTPIFAVVSHPKVVTEPVATLSIVFHYPTNVALIYVS